MPRRSLTIAPLAAALALLAACGPHGTGAAARPSHAAAAAPAPSGSAALAPPTGPLGRLLPYPDGVTPWVDNRTGTFDLTTFVGQMYVRKAWKTERAALVRHGFRLAVRRGWINGDSSQDELWLVDFRDGTGARAMYRELAASWPGDGRTVRTFAAPSVHGRGAADTALDSLGNASAKVAAVSGRTVVFVRVFTAGRPDRAAAVALAARQLARLTR